MKNMIQRFSNIKVGIAIVLAIITILFAAVETDAQCTYGWGNIFVTSPSAGQQVTRNTTMTIRWYGDRYTIGNYGGQYQIEYSTDGQASWTVISSTIDGYALSFAWLIPANANFGTNWFMRVSEVPGPSWSCAFSNPGTSAQFTVLKGCFPPGISSQPRGATVCVGGSQTFTVASDLVGGTYEWRRNSVALATTTSSSYTVSPVTLASAGLYDVVLRDNCNPATATTTSSSVQLNVIESPVITVNLPATRVVCESANDTLRIRSTGAGRTFVWRKDGVVIPGAIDSNYVINNATGAASGVYQCTVTGTCPPPATSVACALTVALKPRVTAEPNNLDICPGTNGSLSVTATGINLTYQWFKDGVAVPNGFNPTLNFTNYGYASNGQYYAMIGSNIPNPNNCVITAQTRTVRVSGFRAPTVKDSPDTTDACVGANATLVAEFDGSGLTFTWTKNGVVIPNATSNSLTIAGIKPTDAGDYVATAMGTCNLTAASGVAKITVIAKPVLSLQPATQTLAVGDKLMLSVNASDWRTIQWNKNDKPIAGATSPTFTINKATKADAGYYNALVRNGCGGVSSSYATITVNDPTVPAPAIELSTMAIDFGEIPVGYDKSQTFGALIKNAGTAPLTVSSLSTNPSEFSVTNAPATPFSLDPGASSSVTLKAAPTNKGSVSGSLVVMSNAPLNPTSTITLTASYVLRYDNALSSDFGTVFTDTTGDKCITVTNTSAMNISIEQASVTGANSGLFTVTTTLPLAIAGGQTADICVKFAPGTVGNKAATLTLRSSSGGNSSVALAGMGELRTGVVEASEAGISAMPNPMTDRVEIRFAKATPEMNISIVGSTGRMVASFSNDAVEAGGSVRWNGLDASGAQVASGSYTMVIRYAGTSVSLALTVVR